MAKKIIAVVILILVIQYYLNTQQKPSQKEDKSTSKTEKLQQLVNSMQVSQNVSKAASSLLSDYNGRLPVHANKWEPVTHITRDEWPAFEHVLQEYGYSYREMYDTIDKPSSEFWHTGFYKKEFDEIRQSLKQRSTW